MRVQLKEAYMHGLQGQQKKIADTSGAFLNEDTKIISMAGRDLGQLGITIASTVFLLLPFTLLPSKPSKLKQASTLSLFSIYSPR